MPDAGLFNQSCESTKAKWQSLGEFDPRNQTWVVSDLRSKLEVQTHLLEKWGGIPADSVMRARELWQQVFRRTQPSVKIVSLDWIYLQASHWLMESHKNLFLENPNLIKTVVDLVDSMAPVFLHPERDSILKDYFENFPETKDRFEKVWPVCIEFADSLNQQQIVAETWVPLLLENGDWAGRVPGFPDDWTFTFDLGGSLSSAEVQLLQNMSRHHSVKVLSPAKNWQERFPFLLQPYQSLSVQGQAAVTENPDASEISDRVHCRKFSGRLAEVKDCVSQVRQWLDSGVPLEKVAVISCTLEMDFPALKSYFLKEGIPVAGHAIGKLHSLPVVQEGLSRFRLWGQESRFSDLSVAFREGLDVRFEKFQGLYKNLLSTQDFSRQTETQRRIADWKWIDSDISLEEFYNQSVSRWPKKGLPVLHRIFEKIFEATPKASVLPLSKWFQWVELIAAKIEIPSSDEIPMTALTIASHRSAESPHWTHRYFLNLVEGEFNKSKNLLSPKETGFLGTSYGFFLPHPEQTIERFEISWLLAQTHRETTSADVLGYPLTDWGGAPTTPNPEWMLRSAGQREVHVPGETRWDSIQHQQESSPDQSLPRKIPWLQPGPLSISSIENFLDCPFIFTAKKRLNLRDDSEVDVTLDPRQKGTLLHRILEKIFTPPVQWDRTQKQIEALLDDVRGEMKDLFIWETVWPSLKKSLGAKTKRVLELEIEFQKQFPQREILRNEAEFKIYFDPEDKKWTTTPNDQQIAFRGKIDRIDGVNGQALALLDYKTSSSSAQSVDKWVRDNKLQMGFYSWVVDQSFVESLSGKVLAGTFFGLKNLDRQRGFQTSEGSGILFEEASPKDFSRAQVEDLWKEIIQTVEQATLRIIEGEYQPAPRDEGFCDRCEWRGLCRAPHLNR